MRPADGASRRLLDAEPGDRLTVVAVEGEPSVRLRLLEMGLVPGTPFTFVRRAPLGDPLELRVRGARLAVSRENAACLSCR